MTAATQLNDAFNSGSVSMTPEGVQALITYTQGLQTAVAESIAQQSFLSQAPKLGSTPAAGTFTSYLPTIATEVGLHHTSPPSW